MKKLTLFTTIILTLISCNTDSQKKKADSLKRSALEAIEAKEFSSVINYAQEAIKAYTKISDTIGIIESNYLIARASALSGDFDNAVHYGEAGSELCSIIDSFQLEYKLNNTLSWAYFELGKGFDENLKHQERQLYVVEQLNDDDAKAGVYNNYGYDATVSGTIPLTKAIEYTNFANNHYAKTEKNKGRWYTLMNLSWQHRLINDLPKSEEYGRLSVKQAENDNDRHAIIEASTNLGETLMLQNKMEEAKPLYERALELSTQKEDRDKYVFDVYYSRYLWNISHRETAIAKLKTAISFLEESEIFYEMLARATLAEYSYYIKDIGEATKQIAVFKNPRANYFSQESKVLVKTVEAQIISAKDKEKAIEVLENELLELNKSGAQLLKVKILDLIDRMP